MDHKNTKNHEVHKENLTGFPALVLFMTALRPLCSLTKRTFEISSGHIFLPQGMRLA